MAQVQIHLPNSSDVLHGRKPRFAARCSGFRLLVVAVFTSGNLVFGWFIHNHPRHRPATFLLLGRIHAVRIGVDSEAVHHALDRKVLELSKVVGVFFLDNRNSTARTGRIGAFEARIELHDIGAGLERKVSNCFMRREIENGQVATGST